MLHISPKHRPPEGTNPKQKSREYDVTELNQARHEGTTTR